MPYEDEDLLDELIEESTEHLTSLEPDLLTLEKEGGRVSTDLVNRVFRAMHSIKGGFAFFGLSHIVDLSHAMESVLMRVRDGELSVTSEMTDAFLAGVDKLRVLLADVRSSESISIQKELAPLTAILEGSGRQAPVPGAEPVAEESLPEEDDSPVEAESTPSLELVKPGGKAAPATAKKEKTAEASESIRVKVGLLDNLMNLAGELVLGRNQIKLALNSRFSEAAAASSAYMRMEDELTRSREAILAAEAASGRGNEQLRAVIGNEFTRIRDTVEQTMNIRLIETPGVSAVMQDVDLVTSELQSGIMNTRMQPVGTIFGKFPRIMRDLAKSMGKEINLELVGQDVELDKSIIETLGDPLTHLVRNSADHGIEPANEREQAGKPRQGNVRLRAYHEGGQVNIDITDDGKGIDPERIKAKAIDRGLISPESAEKITDREAMRLIFAPGFSTAEVISEVSGRGVGMDVVRTNIEQLGGTVDIESTAGEGTRINLRLPLTLAIIPSLIVGTAGRRYAVPQVNLEELVLVREQDTDKRIEEIQGKSVLRLRGKLLPLVGLAEVLGIDGTPNKKSRPDESDHPAAEEDRRGRARNVLVLKVGANRYGLVVENLLDSEEIVVKPLSGYLKDCRHYAGSTIMGDGRVAMILDAAGIAEAAGLRFGEIESEEAQLASQQRATEGEVQPLLLFRSGSSELFALSLALVARIEKVRACDIERVGRKRYVTYADHSMRILHLHDYLPIDAPPEEPKEFFVIVPKLVSHPMGIVATKVEDILHSDAEIDQKNVAGQGVLGSAVLDGRLIVFLDVYGLFEAAEPEEYRHEATEAAGNLNGLRVLIAEDTAFFRTVEAEYLRTFGCEVDTALNGVEAWEMLCQGDYDLLVTDIDMPEMDGFELTEKVRSSERYHNLPVVAVTALHSEDAQIRGAKVGVDAYEIKLDKGRIKKAMEAAIQKRREEQKWSGNSQPSSSEKRVSVSTS